MAMWLFSRRFQQAVGRLRAACKARVEKNVVEVPTPNCQDVRHWLQGKIGNILWCNTMQVAHKTRTMHESLRTARCRSPCNFQAQTDKPALKA